MDTAEKTGMENESAGQGEKREKESRMLWLDALKGIAMIMVIIGHGPVVSEHVNQWINAFHMPLFFCIAGYTFKKKENVRQFAANKFARLMKPYFFTVGMLMISALLLQFRIVGMDWQKFGGGQIAFRWIWAGIYGSCWPYEKPFVIYDIGAIWFLCALFCGEIVFQHLLHVKEESIPFFVVLLAYLGIETRVYFWFPWGLQSGLTALVFLYAGYLAREHKWLATKIPLCAHVIMGFCILTGLLEKSMAICGNNTYTHGWFTMAVAVFLSYYTGRAAQFLVRYALFLARWFAFYGKNSLVILCFHLVELDFVPWTSFVRVFADERMNHMAVLGCKMGFAAVVVVVKNRTWLRKIFG